MSLLARRSGPTSTPTPAGSGYSLLDAQLAVTGDLDTTGSLRIDGKLEGNVRRADTVVLGVGAAMSGDVHAREVVIGGTIILAAIIWILSLFVNFPLIGQFFQDTQSTLQETTHPQ